MHTRTRAHTTAHAKAGMRASLVALPCSRPRPASERGANYAERLAVGEATVLCSLHPKPRLAESKKKQPRRTGGFHPLHPPQAARRRCFQLPMLPLQEPLFQALLDFGTTARQVVSSWKGRSRVWPSPAQPCSFPGPRVGPEGPSACAPEAGGPALGGYRSLPGAGLVCRRAHAPEAERCLGKGR